MTTEKPSYFLINDIDFKYLQDTPESLETIQRMMKEILDNVGRQPADRPPLVPTEDTVTIKKADLKAMRIAWIRLSSLRDTMNDSGDRSYCDYRRIFPRIVDALNNLDALNLPV